MQVDSSEGYMTSPKYHFNVTGGSGSAERVDMLDNERSVFTQGTYTACQCESNPAWYIRGSEFDFDTGADEGVAHNGVLFFQGVPIFAFAVAVVPAVGRRGAAASCRPRSRSSSTNGFELIAAVLLQHRAESRPDADAASHLEARSCSWMTTFRYLSPTYSGSITGDVPAGRRP